MRKRFQHFGGTTLREVGRGAANAADKKAGDMLLAGKAAELKAKLTQKGGKYLT